MSADVESIQIGGTVEPGWEGVRDAFAYNLADTEEVGAATAVYHRGRQVVSLWGGSFDQALTQPYDEQTLQLVFSTTKGITAIALAMCVDRGLIAYADKVSAHWPEFAAHGKGDATVAQLVSHQCGLYTVDGALTLAEALDWNTITARLADTAPRWPIGTAHGYHAVTFGFLAGELVRRVDPQHRSLGTFVREEIAAPLGVEFWIGLPLELEPRVSPILPTPPPDDPMVIAMMAQFMGPGTPGGDALTLNGALRDPDTATAISDSVINSRQLHAAEVPAANGITNAASLARIYAATIAPVDGVRLLTEGTRNVARATVTPEGEADSCLVFPTTFGMGFMTHGGFTMYAGPGSYGHPGAGGSVGWAQPERDLAFGYVMNQMATNLAGDLRAQRLADAAAACADAI